MPATPAVRPGTTHRGRPDQTPIIRASSQKQITGKEGEPPENHATP